MSRLSIENPGQAQKVLHGLYMDMDRRIVASQPGLCPVDMSLNFLRLCHAQTCGKCVPCRVGLTQLSNMIREVLDGEPDIKILKRIEKTAQVIVDTADCAIGIDAANLVLMGLRSFRDDYEEHILHHRCLGSLKNPVPCVALCPAGRGYSPVTSPLVNEGALRRRGAADPQGQSLPGGLRLHLRAPLRGKMPQKYGRRCHQHPRP